MAARKSATTKSSVRPRRARGSLSREEILAAARALIENDGLQQLSYPRLAKRLNAGASSLYWYFHSKDDLLAGVVDEVSREMYQRLAPIGDGPWDEEIVAHHVAFRRLLESSPVYREIFAYRAQTIFVGARMAHQVMRSVEDDLVVFVRAGLDPDEALQAFNAFSVYTRAFVLIEQGIDEDDIDDDSLQMMSFALARVAAELPALGSLKGVDQILHLDDELFVTGLRLLVAGLCARYPALRRTASSPTHADLLAEAVG